MLICTIFYVADPVIAYSHEFGNGEIPIKVRKFNQAEIVTTRQDIQDGKIILYVDVKNTGPNRFSGLLDLEASLFKGTLDVDLDIDEIQYYKTNV
jgi:hypothetical protein